MVHLRFGHGAVLLATGPSPSTRARDGGRSRARPPFARGVAHVGPSRPLATVRSVLFVNVRDESTVTLIISVASPDAVLQASDRRFVWLRPSGAAQRRDDEANKALFYAGRMAFAFTGLAEMGPRRQRTDEWMADVLNPVSGQAEALEALSAAATERFQHRLIKQLPPSMRTHEFVGVGWARFPPDHNRFEPYLAMVSNSRSDTGEPVEPQDRFTWRVLRTNHEHPVIASTAGQRLDDEALETLQSGLDGYARGALTVLGLSEALIDSVRGMADRNPLIGHGLMLNCLPRAAVEDPPTKGVMLASAPANDVPTFLSVPPGEANGVLVGPIFVAGGNRGVLRNFEARPLDTEQSQAAGAD